MRNTIENDLSFEYHEIAKCIMMLNFYFYFYRWWIFKIAILVFLRIDMIKRVQKSFNRVINLYGANIYILSFSKKI